MLWQASYPLPLEVASLRAAVTITLLIVTVAPRATTFQGKAPNRPLGYCACVARASP